MNFKKYQGAGNDFVMLDGRDGRYNTPEFIAHIPNICDRRFGVGADGLLIVVAEAGYAFRMVYYNSDGSRADFCGNGARCICAFACEMGIVSLGAEFTFIADDGVHRAVCGNRTVDLQMIDVESVGEVRGGTFMNTGVPHFVKIVDDIDAVDIMKEAPAIRFDTETFGEGGTNVNFIHIDERGEVSIRTYERGVEGETLACGTGVVASAITASRITGENKITVHAKGGTLRVMLNPDGEAFRNVVLSGPAVKVFEGAISFLR